MQPRSTHGVDEGGQKGLCERILHTGSKRFSVAVLLHSVASHASTEIHGGVLALLVHILKGNMTHFPSFFPYYFCQNHTLTIKTLIPSVFSQRV